MVHVRFVIFLSFLLLTIQNNLSASSSTSLTEDPLVHETPTLSLYLSKAQELVTELGKVVDKWENSDQRCLEYELERKRASIDFLKTFKDKGGIFDDSLTHRRSICCKGGNAGTYYAPRPNVHMDFVYNSTEETPKKQSQPWKPIGFHISFYPINNFGCTTNDLIWEGLIPFSTIYFRQSCTGGMDPIIANQFAGRNRLLMAHVLGPDFTSDQTVPFYDQSASQKIRQVLWHTQMLEPFFTQTAERHGNIQENAYDAYLEQFINLLDIDKDSDREFFYPDAVDSTTRSSYLNYWSERELAFKGLISRAKRNPKIAGTEKCYDLLNQLVEFNPFNIRF